MLAQPLPATPVALASYIDLSVLAEDVTPAQVLDACRQALEYRYASVCVRPRFVGTVAGMLRGSSVKTCAAISVPLGVNTNYDKEIEACQAITDGAQEIDWVFDHHKLTGCEDGFFSTWPARDEVVAIAALDRRFVNILFKVAIETCVLNNEQKRWVCACLATFFRARRFMLGASTGLDPALVLGDGVDATAEDVTLMLAVGRGFNRNVQAKASGGIKTLAAALAMIRAGATRLGMGTADALAVMHEAVEGWKD